MKEDSHIPPPGLAAERFTPYTGYLPQNSVNSPTVKQEVGSALPSDSESIATHPSQSSGRPIAAAAARWLDRQKIQSAPRTAVQGPAQNHSSSGTASSAPGINAPHVFANQYTTKVVSSLANTIGTPNLTKAGRNNPSRNLYAAKTTILNLLTTEQKNELNFENIPVFYTGMWKIARQLDLIIPQVCMQKGQHILPLDRTMRAAQKYINWLRKEQVVLPTNALHSETQDIADGELQPIAELEEETTQADKKVASSTNASKKDRRAKNKSKAQTSEDDESAPIIETKLKASKKRKHESDSGAQVELVDKSSKDKKQKSSAPAIEQEMPESELEQPKAKKKKEKKKQAVKQCSPIGEDIPEREPLEKKNRKHKSHPKDDVASEPARDHRKKKTKRSSIPEEVEIPGIPQTEPNFEKKKKKKARESSPVNENPLQNTSEPHFDADASFLSEALGTTEERNYNLTQEIQNLRSILQAVGVGGVKLSVALTRMRHGQSAEEIFSSIKREDS